MPKESDFIPKDEPKENTPVTAPAPKQEADTDTTSPDNSKQADGAPSPEAGAEELITVKVDGVEQQVSKNDLLELGKKFYGLDGHFTRKGQELSEKEKQLQSFQDQLLNQKNEIEDRIQSILEERDKQQQMLEFTRKEQEELEALREIDPEGYKLRKELRETKSKIQEFDEKIQALNLHIEQQRQLEAQNTQKQLLLEVRNAADKYDVPQEAILGYYLMHPDSAKKPPQDIAEKISEMEKSKQKKVIDEYERGRSQAKNLPNVPSGRTNIPQTPAKGTPRPDLFKETDKFNTELTKLLEQSGMEI